MTRLLRETVKCVKCNNECDVIVLASTNMFGAPDLDLRPAEMQRSTMGCWLQHCHYCGYVNYDLSKDNGVSIEFLKSGKLKKIKEEYLCHRFHLARLFYNYHLEMLEVGDVVQAYESLLHAAWCYDDARLVLNAKSCRKKMLTLYDCIPKEKINDEAFIARHMDVMRRAHGFKKVLKRYADFKPKDDRIKKVVDYQLKLCKKRDARCHTLNECQ